MAPLTAPVSEAPALTLASRRRVVVKIGSALLVDALTGALRADWLAGLAADVADLRARVRRLCLSRQAP